MRLVFLLALSYWVAGPAWARKPPVVTDTATLNFMRWYLASGPNKLSPPYRLAQLTTRWRQADIDVLTFDTATTFSHKLRAIHAADTIEYTPQELFHYRALWKYEGVPTNFFSRADLAAMRQRYYQETRMSWPILAPTIIPSKKKYARYCFVGTTLPLFSLDGRHTVLWHFYGCWGSTEAAQLQIFERNASGHWQARPAHLPGWIQ